MRAHGRTYRGWYLDSQNLCNGQRFSFVKPWIFVTHSGEIIFATEAATMHEVIRVSFLVWPVVVVPAQFRPSKYDGLNVEIWVPTIRATLFDHGAASYSMNIRLMEYCASCGRCLTHLNYATNKAWDIGHCARVTSPEASAIQQRRGGEDKNETPNRLDNIE